MFPVNAQNHKQLQQSTEEPQNHLIALKSQYEANFKGRIILVPDVDKQFKCLFSI